MFMAAILGATHAARCVPEKKKPVAKDGQEENGEVKRTEKSKT
jgi:hypothetical protein